MGFKPGNKLQGSRKGVPNKPTQELEEIARRIGCNPFEVLMMIAAGDFKGLGYSSPDVTKVLKDGGTLVEDRISLDQRCNAAKEACKYLFPQRKAIEVSNSEDNAFVVKIIDYGSKTE